MMFAFYSSASRGLFFSVSCKIAVQIDCRTLLLFNTVFDIGMEFQNPTPENTEVLSVYPDKQKCSMSVRRVVSKKFENHYFTPGPTF